jgi:WD40 repeat protein
VLRTLVGWLTAPEPDSRMCVVTGSPGSGKSAVLSRLVTLSDPAYRRLVPLEGVPEATIPPVSSIDAALHAKGKTLGDLADSLAAALGLGNAEVPLIVDELSRRAARVVIVVDALDEAIEPVEITRRLLHPLVSVPAVRLLVGTRREYLSTLGPSRDPIDLDHPDYLDPADGFDLRLMSWGDGSGVPTSGTDLVIVGTDSNGLLHIRIFSASSVLTDTFESKDNSGALHLESVDASGKVLSDVLESVLTTTQAGAISTLKQQFPGLLPPRVLTSAEKDLVLSEVTSIIDQTPADITEYARLRLLAEDDLSSPTPYRDRPDLARKVAEAIAEKASPNFLIARLVVEELIVAERPVDVRRGGWRDRFPSTVGAAFDEYLARFRTAKDRVRDLLRPLAHAEGAGLPWEDLWARLASALSGKDYTDHDIRWLLDHANSYVVEQVEQGRSVYRLYHQALADHLRGRSPEAEAHRRITAALIAHTPDRIGGDGKDWLNAHPYTRKHLATHAALAGRLASLVDDPLYLLAADPVRLLRSFSLGAPADAPSAAITAVYRRCVHLLRASPLAEAASYLELAAHQGGARELAERVARLPLRRPWCVSWAHWRLANPFRILAHHGGEHIRVAVGQVRGRPVIVSKDEFSAIRITDLATGTPVHADLLGNRNTSVVAVVELDGRPVIVSGSEREIQLWDLAEGTWLRGFRGLDEGATPVAVGRVAGRAVIATVRQDRVLRVWGLADGSPVGKPLAGDEGQFQQVAVAERKGRPVVVSGGGDGSLRIWDLRDGTLVGKPLAIHEDMVSSLVVAELAGRPITVSGDDQALRLWDLIEGVPAPQDHHLNDRSWFHALEAYTSVDAGEFGGRLLVAAAGSDGCIRAWALSDSTLVGMRFDGHGSPVTSVAIGQLGGRPILVSGGQDGTVCAWDFAEGTPLDGPELPAGPGQPTAPDIPTGGFTAVAVGASAGRPLVFAASSGGRVQSWDLVDGTPVGELVCYTSPFDKRLATLEKRRSRGVTPLVSTWAGLFQAIGVGQLGDRPVFIGARNLGVVETWGLADGMPVGQPFQRKEFQLPQKVALGENAGRPLIAACDSQGTVRVWELARRRLAHAFRIPSVARDAYWAPVAVGQLGHRFAIASSAVDPVSVQVWDPTHGTLMEEFHTGLLFSSIAVGELAGRPAIAVGDSQGRMFVWPTDVEAKSNLIVFVRMGDIRFIQLGASIHSLAFAEGSRLIVGTSLGVVVLHLGWASEPEESRPRKHG